MPSTPKMSRRGLLAGAFCGMMRPADGETKSRTGQRRNVLVTMIDDLRPDSSRVWWIGPQFRDHVPDVLTLPEHFKPKKIHYTRAFGKVYHDKRLHAPGS